MWIEFCDVKCGAVRWAVADACLQKIYTRVIKSIVWKLPSEPWSKVRDENENQKSGDLCYLHGTVVELAQGELQFTLLFHPFKHISRVTRAQCTCAKNIYRTFHFKLFLCTVICQSKFHVTIHSHVWEMHKPFFPHVMPDCIRCSQTLTDPTFLFVFAFDTFKVSVWSACLSRYVSCTKLEIPWNEMCWWFIQMHFKFHSDEDT